MDEPRDTEESTDWWAAPGVPTPPRQAEPCAQGSVRGPAGGGSPEFGPHGCGAGAQWPGVVLPAAGQPDPVPEKDAAGVALVRLQRAVDALLGLDPTGLSAERLVAVLTELETQARRLPAVRHRIVTEVAARGIGEAHGCRSTAAFLRRLLRLSPGEAASWVRTAYELTGTRSLTTGQPLPAKWPLTAAAQAAGAISAEQVRAITATLHRLPAALGPDDRSSAEASLVATAIKFDPKRFAIIAERLLAYLDPDGTLDRHHDARRLRGVTISLPGPDGLSRISGWLTPLVREAILAALEPLAAPNPLHPDNVATSDPQPTDAQPTDAQPTVAQPTDAQPTDAQPTHAPLTDAPLAADQQPDGMRPDGMQPDGAPRGRSQSRHLQSENSVPDRDSVPERSSVPDRGPPGAGPVGASPRRPIPAGTQLRDCRSAAQRTHDALGEVCERILGSATLPMQAGMPATLLLIARLCDIEARLGVATTATGGTVPVPDAIRTAARANLIPAVFDTDGAPLWLGRTQRLASLAQRHALVARDIGCTVPGCDLGAWRCQVHHGPPWAPRHPGDTPGRTDIDTMALICGYDHHRIDDWTMTVHGGRVWWTPPPWIDSEQTPRTNTYFKPLGADEQSPSGKGSRRLPVHAL